MTHHEHAPAGHGDHGEHHVVPVPVYLHVFFWLMVLLVVTLVAAAIDLGSWNLPIAMSIAVAKAVIIVLYFMHVRWSPRLVQFFSVAALFWLMLLFVITAGDYASRHLFR